MKTQYEIFKKVAYSFTYLKKLQEQLCNNNNLCVIMVIILK